MKSSVFSRLMALGLAVSLSLGLGFPAKAQEAAENEYEVSFAAAKDDERTVYWAHGITPPELPKDFDGNAPFGVPYDPEGGWYDLNRDRETDRDGAAAAANLLHWWLDLNREAVDTYLSKNPIQPEEYRSVLAKPQDVKPYLEAPKSQKLSDSPLYQFFDQQAGDKVYPPDAFLDFFLVGYELNQKQNKPDDFNPSSGKGGFFYPAFDMISPTSRVTKFSDSAEISKTVKEVLQQECGMILSLKNGDEINYVNLWGAEFDSEGQLLAIYVTDSDDVSDEKQSMVRYVVHNKDGKVTMDDLKGNQDMTWDTLYQLFVAADLLEDPTIYPETEPKPEWQVATYAWTDDLNGCTATRQDKNDEDNVDVAEAQVSKEQTKAPTGKQPGIMTYTASFSEDWAENQTREEEIPAQETQWGETTYRWAAGYTGCTATRTDRSDVNTSETAQATVTSKVTKEAGVGTPGEIVYTAVFDVPWASTQNEVSQIPALEQEWTGVSYHWSPDYSACTAKRKSNDGKEETAKAVVESKSDGKADCTHEGTITYTAKFSESWAQTQTETVTGTNAGAHNWGSTQYKWNEDYSKCMARRVCENNNEHQEIARATVTSKRTKEPTATEKGQTTYTAVFTESWASTQTAVADDIKQVTDNWENPTYTWSANNRQCTAKRVNKDDKTRVETATAKVTFKQTKAPTDTQKGETTYYANFPELWAKNQTRTVADIPPKKDTANDELWNEPTYEWSEDYSRCTASRTKKKDASTVDMAHGRVTEKVITEATCQLPGKSTFTAVFSESWAKNQEKTVEVTAGKHTLEKVPEVPATAGQDGTKAHYRCTACQKLFLDEEGKQEVTEKDLILEKKSAMSGSNVVIEAIPEKENTVAITPELLEAALKENRDAKGVLINIGEISVVYSRETANQLLSQNKGAKKLVLKCMKTNFSDGGLNTDQALAVQKNGDSQLYLVSLTNGKKELQAPCTVMLPYDAATAEPMVYQVTEEGGFRQVVSQFAKGYLAWNADTGYYMASETVPAAQKQKSGGGMLIWVILLVVVGLALLGAGGFFLYRKLTDSQEEYYEDDSQPQLDEAARERIRNVPPHRAPMNQNTQYYQPQQQPRQQTAAQQPQAPQQTAPRQPQAPQTAAPVYQPNPDLQATQPIYQTPVQPIVEPEIPEAGIGEVPQYQGAFEAPQAAPTYQGAFEAQPEPPKAPEKPAKPTIADKTVQAAHRAHQPKPQEYAPREEDDLDALKHWLDQVDQ